MGFVFNLLLFPNRLGFDKVIAIRWVIHFILDTVYL